MALCWSLDKIGQMCRYAEDTALVLAGLNSYDPRMLEADKTTPSDRAAF